MVRIAFDLPCLLCSSKSKQQHAASIDSSRRPFHLVVTVRGGPCKASGAVLMAKPAWDRTLVDHRHRSSDIQSAKNGEVHISSAFPESALISSMPVELAAIATTFVKHDSSGNTDIV